MAARVQAFTHYIKTHKTKSAAVLLGVFFVVSYCLAFLLPKPVLFSYAGETCVRQFTIAPKFHMGSGEGLAVSFKDEMKLGAATWASMKTCFAATTEPKPGKITAVTAPFGSFIAAKRFMVAVPATPKADISGFGKPIPVSKPIIIPMSQPDSVFTYTLRNGDIAAPCEKHERGISCDVPRLRLEQGKAYDLSLSRQFKSNAATVITSRQVETLRAVTLKDAMIKPGQTLYSRPKVLTFTTDKPLAEVSTRLVSDGKPIKLTETIDGSSVSLVLSEELPREKSYRLIISQLEAEDGSTLVEPYEADFKTSGGPKVIGVSVGANKVGQSANVIVTFDQPLSKNKDVTQFFAFNGGTASIRRQSDTQVAVQLGALPLCQPFAITVKQGIPSEYDLTSAKAWSFSSRTICHTVSTYGTSLRGRPLTAYTFGSSGPVTMYVGGIHGNEPSSTNLMRAWIDQLEANPTRIAGKRIVVIPAINPDGLAANGRSNSRGVNLNRNFPTDNWTKSIKDTDGTHPAGGGETPLSEPEASALARITTAYRPRLLLSFHAVGSLAIGDPGGYSAAYAARYASLVGYRNGTGTASSNFDYDVTGGYEDWTYRNQGIPSIVVELSSYSSVNYAGHYNALWAMLE